MRTARALLPLLLLSLALLRPAAATELTLAPGAPLDRARVLELVEPRLEGRFAGSRFAIELFQPALPLANAATEPTRITLVDWRQDPGSGRFEARLLARLESGARSRITVVGRARELVPVPVPRRNLARGTVLTAEMFEESWLPASRLREDTVMLVEDLTGLELRRSLRRGQPVRRGQVQWPRLVRRGDVVTLVFSRPGLILTALGRALEDGAEGQIIRLVNLDSERPLRGRVTGPRRATIIASEAR